MGWWLMTQHLKSFQGKKLHIIREEVEGEEPYRGAETSHTNKTLLSAAAGSP